ncbi:MAG TPA: alpha/beta fold hydrolase [Candidatus Limnocylindrales bacterium]
MTASPDDEAVALLDGGSVVSWAELDRRCAAAAGGMVVVDGTASIDAVVTILGVVRAGGVAAIVPPGLTAAERATAVGVFDAAAHDGPGVVVLTSGTTARPKGVVLSGAALAASADAWLAALPPATGWLLALSLGHVAGLGVLWRAIAGRVPMRIVSGAEPAAILEALSSEPPLSHVSLVPAQLARLLDECGDAKPPPTLRAVLLGGGTIPPALVTRALDAGWPVVPTYGLSEAGSGVTALPTAEAREAPTSAGRPLPGVTIAIETPDADGIGEILVTTPARFEGYAGEPRGDGPIRTGDLGRLDDERRLYVVDRRTDRIVRGGENVAPAEVEAVLIEQPAIADAAVVARRDDVLGQVPVAAIVVRVDATDPGDDAFLRACRDRLAGFKVPASIVRLDALPRTAGGKLRRDAVRALVDGASAGILARPEGDEIGWRVTGSGPQAVVLLPGTLSNAAQLDRLAGELAQPADLTIHAIDRRGMGTSRLARPVVLDVDIHVRDLVAYLDARGIDRAIVVGVSFGGVVALELAARHPERILALVAWEPPYGPLADPSTQARFATLAAETANAHKKGGPAASAETFLRAVAGDAAWDRLPERARAFLAREGDGALTDAALVGLDPDGLAHIEAPTTILTGSASERFYAPIADALASRIPAARRDTLDGLAHPAPITEPARFAGAVRQSIAEEARS